MILKSFYDDADYEVVMKLLHKVRVSDDDIERVKTRQLFLESLNK